MISSFPIGVCQKVRRPPLAAMEGGGYVSLHTLRPTIGGQRALFYAREGGEHAAQFGVARFAGGSSWKFQELLPMRVDALCIERPDS